MQSWLQQALNLVANNGNIPRSKVYGANMELTWAQQDPGGPYVGLMDLAIWYGIWDAGVLVAIILIIKNMLAPRAITPYLRVDHVEFYVAHYRAVSHVSIGLFVFLLQVSKQMKYKIVQMIVPCIQCHVCSHTQIHTFFEIVNYHSDLFQFFWHFTLKSYLW